MDYKKKYLKYKIKYLNLKEQLGGAKYCTIKELMDLPDYDTECKNLTHVNGSCGEPSFKHGLSAKISDDVKDSYLKLIEIIKNHSNKPINVIFIIGALTKFNQNLFPSKNSLIICITPTETFGSFIDINNELEKEEDLNNKVKFINSYFPLNHIDTNSKLILDKLIELDEITPIGIVNKMCGTCHRSFYYLLKNKENIKYEVNPEQGLNPVMDTQDIKQCFNNLVDNDYNIYRGKWIRATKENPDEATINPF
jgi:hypothetical protein